ncbi:MAG: sulfatase-like hydrolase/transferase [Gemmatimonadaceae bacterium]
MTAPPMLTQVPTDLVDDGGFESGATLWQNHDAPGRQLDPSNAHSGTYAQAIIGSSSGALAVYQDVAVSAGTLLDANGFAQADALDGTGATVAVVWLNSAGIGDSIPAANLIAIDTVGTVNGTAAWTTMTRRVTAPVGAVVARLQLDVDVEADGTGTAWFDDISLLATPPADQPPTVSVTVPAAGAHLSGSVALTADASDDRGVESVQFLVDGIAVGAPITAAPFALTYATDTLTAGNHQIAARARDDAAQETTSAAVDVLVDNLPPKVQVTAPTAGATLTGIVNLVATATDNDGISGVQFLVDNIPVGSEVTTAPYGLAYATDTLVGGQHVFTARARDLSGTLGTSAAVAVTIDQSPPVVVVTSPAPGSVGGVVTLAANASDDGAVLGVRFYIDAIAVGQEVTTPPYSLAYTTDTLLNGTHQVTASARDGVGRTTLSTGVSILVNNPPPKDVVIILTDDQRHDTMPYMPLTSSLLNAETVRFSRAFVTTSLCCPSRSSLLTGLYSHNTGVLSNAAPSGGATKFNDQSTLATWLQGAGYRTALIGKYLNQYEVMAPHIPAGWSDFEAMLFLTANNNTGYLDYSLNTNGVVSVMGPSTSDYSTDVLANRAMQFIRSTKPRQPLFLYFTPFAPHQPWLPYPSDVGRYSGFPNWRPPAFNESDVSDKPAWIRALPLISASQQSTSDAAHRSQLESLQAVDRAVSNLILTLQQTGRWNNTLVIFSSDNGYMWGEHRLVDRKLCPYEECIRVPFWVRAPGLVARADTQIVANIDIAPTVAAWAGVTIPTKVNGLNMLPLLQNPGATWRLDLLIEQLSTGKLATQFSGVRTARYFYNEYQNGDREFYDFKTDPNQLTNTVNATGSQKAITVLKQRLALLKAQ